MSAQKADHEEDMVGMRKRRDDSEEREANLLGHALPPPVWKSYRDWLEQERKNLDD